MGSVAVIYRKQKTGFNFIRNLTNVNEAIDYFYTELNNVIKRNEFKKTRLKEWMTKS